MKIHPPWLAIFSLFVICACCSPAARAADDPLAAGLSQAWSILEAGDGAATLAFVDKTLAGIAAEAKKEAAGMRGFAAKDREYDYPKVNAAGTLCYIRALAFQRSGKRAEWLAGLRRVWSEYPFCQSWDPQGWFWRPGEAAKKEGYVEVISAAIRDRKLTESPFPKEEDALDYPQMSIATAQVVSHALEKGEYAQLEYFADRLVRLKIEYPDGDSPLTTFFTAAGGAAGAQKEESAWTLAGERIAAWTAAYPDSPMPRIAEAHRLIQKGWHERGSGYADTVKDEAWADFRRLLVQAREVLEKSPRTCPEWYEERLTIAMALDDSAKDTAKLFAEGWKASPGFQPLLRQMVTSTLPRWGGASGDTLKFGTHLAGSYGARGYALVVNNMWTYEREKISSEKNFDPALYRKGARELLAEHPGSLSLLHKTLVISLSLKDAELSRDAFQRAGLRYHPAWWATAENYLAARKLALGTKD